MTTHMEQIAARMRTTVHWGKVHEKAHATIRGENNPVLPVMPAEGSKVAFDVCQFRGLAGRREWTLGRRTLAAPWATSSRWKVSDDVSPHGTHPEGRWSFRLRRRRLLHGTYPIMYTTVDDAPRHGVKAECDYCATRGSRVPTPKVADLYRLSGRFGQTSCDLRVKTVNCVPWFLHSLSGCALYCHRIRARRPADFGRTEFRGKVRETRDERLFHPVFDDSYRFLDSLNNNYWNKYKIML